MRREREKKRFLKRRRRRRKHQEDIVSVTHLLLSILPLRKAKSEISNHLHHLLNLLLDLIFSGSKITPPNLPSLADSRVFTLRRVESLRLCKRSSLIFFFLISFLFLSYPGFDFQVTICWILKFAIALVSVDCVIVMASGFGFYRFLNTLTVTIY